MAAFEGLWRPQPPGGRRAIPASRRYQNNAACVGGGTLSYGAMAWRFVPQDFRMRSTYGAPAGSSLEDWPITYEDLEPYYEKAEYEIGISGDYSASPFFGPRHRPLPMPPLPPNREFQILEPAAKRLGLHPFHIPMARNSVPYNGRGPCMRCRWCVGFACEVDAKNGSQNTVIPVAHSTGNCELRTGCMAKEILTDDCGHAHGVAYYDADQHLQEQPCDIVVVSACAIESARLLLNSKSRLFPNGIGSRYDQVGRNLQDHHYTRAVGFFDFGTYDDVGPGASIAVADYNHGTPGLSGGSALCNEFIRLPIQMIDRMPPNTPRWGLGHKQAMRNFYKRNMPSWVPLNPFPWPTPWSLWIHRCGTNGACLSRASPATFIPTHLRSASSRPSALKPGSKRPEPSAPWSTPATPLLFRVDNIRPAPAAWAAIRTVPSSIATARFTMSTTSS